MRRTTEVKRVLFVSSAIVAAHPVPGVVILLYGNPLSRVNGLGVWIVRLTIVVAATGIIIHLVRTFRDRRVVVGSIGVIRGRRGIA